MVNILRCSFNPRDFYVLARSFGSRALTFSGSVSTFCLLLFMAPGVVSQHGGRVRSGKMTCNYGFEGEAEDDEICFYIRYDYKGSKRTKPLYLSMDTLGNLSHDEFKYNVIQGIPYLASSPSSTWRLSLQDGEDFVDINNRKYMSLIRKVASRSDKVILNVEESSTPSPVGFDSKTNKCYKLDQSPLRADERIQSGSRKTLFGETCQTDESQMSIIPDVIHTTTSPSGSNIPTTSKFSSPIQVFIKNMEDRKLEAELKLQQAKSSYESFQEALSPKHDVDYHKPMCGICHFRPTQFQRSHNRVNCPTKKPCTSSRFCGDVSKHPAEKDKLRELKQQVDYYDKEFQKAQAELDTNIRIQEKSLDSKLREKLRFEFPTRYQAEGMISYQLLNHDVEVLSRYCKRKRITTLSALGNLPSLLQVLLKEEEQQRVKTQGQSFQDVFWKAKEASEASVQNQSGNFAAIKELWKLKGVKFPLSDTNCGSTSGSSKTKTKSAASLSSAHEERKSYTCKVVEQRSEDYQFALELQMEEDNKETNAVNALVELQTRK